MTKPGVKDLRDEIAASLPVARQPARETVETANKQPINSDETSNNEEQLRNSEETAKK